MKGIHHSQREYFNRPRPVGHAAGIRSLIAIPGPKNRAQHPALNSVRPEVQSSLPRAERIPRKPDESFESRPFLQSRRIGRRAAGASRAHRSGTCPSAMCAGGWRRSGCRSVGSSAWSERAPVRRPPGRWRRPARAPPETPGSDRAIPHFFEVEPRMCPVGRNPDRSQQVAGLQDGHAGDVVSRAGIRGVGRHAAVRVEEGVLPVYSRGRVGVAHSPRPGSRSSRCGSTSTGCPGTRCRACLASVLSHRAGHGESPHRPAHIRRFQPDGGSMSMFFLGAIRGSGNPLCSARLARACPSGSSRGKVGISARGWLKQSRKRRYGLKSRKVSQTAKSPAEGGSRHA